MFSSRLPSLAPNAITRAAESLRAAGVALLDLTETNPTAVGLPYPSTLLTPLADEGGLRYRPDPRGLASAREAVADDYQRQGLRVSPDRLRLTASTSEAYALLFKLLCNPRDEVLAPQPSYPLFDLLTALEGVGTRPYRLDYHGVWSIDRPSVEQALTPATRAVLVVSPNNPTGSLLRAADRDWLVDLCAARGLALIADEVFAGYPLAPRADGCSIAAAGDTPALTVSLGGLSKSAGLPQVKLGWILAHGPRDLVTEALDRLDLISDTYLSVSTPVQLAAPELLAAGRTIQAAIADRLAQNLAVLRARVADRPSITLRAPEGGWSAVLEIPATHSEESVVLTALHDAHVMIHPGHFFDFAQEAFLVTSLLPPPDVFAEAIDRLLPIAAGDAA
jgi:aspartate/methionine/tyrosine aminotransferase